MKQFECTLILIGWISIFFWGVKGEARILTRPRDTTGVEGSNITFYCGVSGQQSFLQALTWNKLPAVSELAVNPFLAPDILTLNQLSGDPDKYLVFDKYRLTVVGITVADEGTYECAMGSEMYFAKLTVAVPPAELVVSYPDSRTEVSVSENVNLTCTARRSRPPALLRWFKGYMDITDQATLQLGQPDESGYGNSSSVLPLEVTAADEGAPFRCVAVLPNLPAVMLSQVRIQLASSAVTYRVTYLNLYGLANLFLLVIQGFTSFI